MYHSVVTKSGCCSDYAEDMSLEELAEHIYSGFIEHTIVGRAKCDLYQSRKVRETSNTFDGGVKSYADFMTE